MKLTNTRSRAVVLITIAVSVIGLIMSPVSAAAAFAISGNNAGAGTPVNNAAYHHLFNSTQQTARLEAVLVNLSQQGVDVSPAQAALTAGNTTAAAQWLMAYHKAHPTTSTNASRSHIVNGTAQAARIQSEVAKLTRQGVDVTKVLADLTNGNITGARQDLMAIHKDRPVVIAYSTQMAARLQTRVTKLGQQGVDVSEIQADLSSGNVSAAMQWLAAYHKAHPAQLGNGTTLHTGNNTQLQKGSSFRQHTPGGSANQTATHPWLQGRAQGTGRTAGV